MPFPRSVRGRNKSGVDGPKAFHSLDFPASPTTSLAKLTLAADLTPPTNILPHPIGNLSDSPHLQTPNVLYLRTSLERVTERHHSYKYVGMI